MNDIKPSDDTEMLTTRGVVLQPVTEADYAGLRQLELGERMLHHWRFGGHTPSPEKYAHMMWDGVYAQYIMIDRGETPRPVGFAMLYDVDLTHGWGYLGAARFMDGVMGSALFMDGLGAFIDLTFKLAPLRKIYLEVPEYNLPTFQSAIGRVLALEGVLKDHRYFDNRTWDVSILSVNGDDWRAFYEDFRTRRAS